MDRPGVLKAKKEHLYNVMRPEGFVLCVKEGPPGSYLHAGGENAAHPQPAPKYPPSSVFC